MNTKLALYIGEPGDQLIFSEESRVDQFKDETVSLTQTIQNVKDIKKIFTEFTKTFSLPASKKNNKIFKHYYNFEIVNGFDARVKVDAKLVLNDTPFKFGKVALTGVQLKKGVPYAYNVVFYGNTVDLKDILGDTQLSSLEQLSLLYDTEYSYDEVLLKLDAGLNDNLICPLISHTDRLYYESVNTAALGDKNGNLYFNAAFNDNGVDYRQLKYAIRLQAIIDAIEYQFPIEFSSDFFNDSSNTDFHNLFMWLHRKKGGVESTAEVVQNWTTVVDLVQTSCNYPNGGCPPNAIAVNGTVEIYPNTLAVLNTTNVTFTPIGSTEYSARVIRNGNSADVVAQFNNLTGTQFLGNVYGTGTPWPTNNSYTVQVLSNDPAAQITFAANGINFFVAFTTFDGGIGQATHNFKNQFSITTSDVIEFNITAQIPQMKIIDFLTALFSMWNLTAYIDDDGIIVVQELDEYYASAPQNPIVIDEYVDVTTSAVDVALPFRRINFSFSGLGTFLVKQYQQLFNSQFGALAYSNNQFFDAPQETYSIEVPFEHVQYERLFDRDGGAATTIQYGYFVDDNREPYYGEPLVFYGVKRTSSAPGTTRIGIRESVGSIGSTKNYWIPMNTKALNSSTSKRQINFQQQLSEYKAFADGDDAQLFTDTLFETQYKSYIQEVFNPQVRLTKLSLVLPYNVFKSLKLNQKVSWRQTEYKINSLTTDLTSGKSTIELLNIYE